MGKYRELILLSLILIFIFPLPVNADFGCKVALCVMSPTKPDECISTLKKLRRRLRKGHSFPKCKTTGGSSAKYRKEIAPCSEAYGQGFINKKIPIKDHERMMCVKSIPSDFATSYIVRPLKMRYVIDMGDAGIGVFYP